MNSHAVPAEDFELPEASADDEPSANVNFAVPWMLTFLLFAIPVYWFCLDTHNRHYFELASRYIPMGYTAVCVAIVYARISRSHLLFWDPMTWFFVASAMLYGFAPLIYFYGNEYSIRFLDTFFVLNDEMLLRTNLLNAVGTFIVCLSHTLAIGAGWRPRGRRIACEDPVRQAKAIFWRLLFISLPLKWFVFVPMYLGFFSVNVPGTLQNIANLINACITLAFFIWFSGEKKYAGIALFLLVADTVVSTLIFSKTFFILPIVQGTLGIFLAKQNKSVLIIGLILASGAYLWVKPLVDIGRHQFGGAENGIESRMAAIGRYVSGDLRQSDKILNADSEHYWTRQSFSSTEGYMINAYDNGQPGNTIKDFWVILIPRVLWPNKPDISAAGRNLNMLIQGYDTTAIGGTVYAEAYWNGGWLMVVLTSGFLGIAFAVFGRLNVYYLEVMDLRWLPLACIGVFYGFSLQDWFVLAYLGTIPIYIAIWYFLKMLFPDHELT